MYIPDTVTEIGNNAFGECKGLKKLRVRADIPVADCPFPYEYGTEYIVDFENGKSLSKDMKGNAKWFRNVTFTGIGEICDEMYEGSNTLKTVTLSGVTKIGYRAFSGCKKLSSVKIENGLQRIEPMAFYGDYSLRSITLPDTLTSLGYGAFQGCDRLASVVMSAGIAEMGKDTFLGCYSLDTMGTDTTAQPATALSGLVVTLDANGNDVTGSADGERALQPLKLSGKTVAIPGSVKTLGNTVFKGCTGLKTVFIPASVKTIESDAFSGIKSSVKFKVIKGSYAEKWLRSHGKGGKTSFTSGKGAEAIVGGIGYRITGSGTAEVTCVLKSSVKKVSIPATATIAGIKCRITGIAKNAFRNCKKLTTVVIGKKITKIGAYAFYGCEKLKRVTIASASIGSIGSKSFSGISAKAAFTLPKKHAAKYAKLLKKAGMPKTAVIKKK